MTPDEIGPQNHFGFPAQADGHLGSTKGSPDAHSSKELTEMARYKTNRKRKLTITGAVVLVLFALLIIGAVLGFTLRKKNNAASKDGGNVKRELSELATRSLAGNVREDSRIAAATAFGSKLIFYQDKDDNL